MKKTVIATVGFFVVVLGWALPDQTPVLSPRFLLEPIGDLREICTDRKVLEDRQNRNVCRVESLLGAHRDVPVTSTTRLQDILISLRKTNWVGEPQIRIIKRNAIIQNETSKKSESPEHWKNFSGTPIEIGDIVIICDTH